MRWNWRILKYEEVNEACLKHVTFIGDVATLLRLPHFSPFLPPTYPKHLLQQIIWITMPPIRSTIQQETTDLIDTLSRRQKDLQEFQIPRLRDYKGPLATQQQYAGEIRDDLELFSKSVKVG